MVNAWLHMPPTKIHMHSAHAPVCKMQRFRFFSFFFYIFRTLLSTADVPRLEFIEHVDFAETALHFMFHRKKTKFVIITGPNLSCSAQLKEFLQM